MKFLSLMLQNRLLMLLKMERPAWRLIFRVLVAFIYSPNTCSFSCTLFFRACASRPLPSNISSYKVFPDKPEKRRASELFKTAIDTLDDITIGSLDDVPGGPVTNFFRSIRNTLDFDFEDENEGRWASNEPPSLYVFINCSTRDLASIEKYVVWSPHCWLSQPF
ncbi:hypothetical protein GBA52_010068 [Prunus armeniaca]|nr:hypothetical protein GBA52_010068 [Prunus armeniaca]